MTSLPKRLNDVEWERLFLKYDILNHIDAKGRFVISAAQIREFREPRLMAKFDHRVNLPVIFSDNDLAILPIARGAYAIAHFDLYHRFENESTDIENLSLPAYIQSLDSGDIPSETIALNCAVAAGIVAEFLQDEEILATVSGRMGSGTFDCDIPSSRTSVPYHIEVRNSQVEIDAAYEGVSGLALFEAKRDLSEDFLVRQLYYPYRVWQSRVTKPVKVVHLMYSNSVFRLHEYAFQDVRNYGSLVLIKQKNYSLEDTTVEISDILTVLDTVKIAPEPRIPFPQADSFQRVINICELLYEQELSRNDITERYAFDARQTNYYTDAARYLGLLVKRNEDGTPIYSLSEDGRKILSLKYKDRQLAYCRCILSHRAFGAAMRRYLSSGSMPSPDEIVQIMKSSDLYQVESDSTFYRRSSTIRGWLNWILGIVNP